MELVIIFIIWLVLGAATAYLANQRGRDPLLWSMGVLTLSLLGVPFSLMGIALLYFLPPIDDDVDVPEKHEFEELVPALPVGMSLDDIMLREWFFYDQARQRHGPLPFQELQAMWGVGHLKADTYVWTEGMDSWKKAADVPDFLEALKSFPLKTIEDFDRSL